jgi:hypothetical protein
MPYLPFSEQYLRLEHQLSQTDILSLRSCYNFCFLHLILGSPLHHSSIATIMGSADSFVPLLELKVSPGNALIPSHLCLPHILENPPCKYWASMACVILPDFQASYAISVRQASVLPSASFRHPFTSLPLPAANASPYRVHRGLPPPTISALPGSSRQQGSRPAPLAPPYIRVRIRRFLKLIISQRLTINANRETRSSLTK